MRKIVLQYTPVLLFCLWLKGCRTRILLPDATPLDYADALAPDLGVQLALLGVVGLALAASGGRASQIAAQVFLGIAALVLILLELTSVVFSWETGGALDHHMFAFSVRHVLSLLPLFVAVLSAEQIVSVVLIVTGLLAFRVWQVARQALPPIRPRGPAILLAVGLLLVVATPVRLPPGPVVPVPVELALGPFERPVAAAPPEALRLPPHRADAHLVRAGAEPPRWDQLVVVALESTGSFATSLWPEGPETTPYLRELAEQSVVFERAYVAVPHSSKAVVALNCGIVPFLLMDVRESEPGGVPVACLPALLKGVGFQTLYFGSHVGGFERWRQLTRNLGFAVTTTAEQLDTARWEIVNYFAIEDDALLDPTRAWLKRVDGRPLYAFYLTSTAHHDYQVPSRYPLKQYVADEKHNRYLNAVYYQDRFLEKLIGVYREAGLYERTLFVVVGDHGEAFGEHGRTLHDGVIYEEGLRVPLLIHAHGLSPRRIPHVVSQVDLMPTLVDLLGFRIEAGSYDGISLFARDEDSVVYASCWYSERCLARIGADRKVISHYAHEPPEAFSLRDDPGELRNLYGESPEDAQHLEELHDWKEQQLGRFLLHGRRR